MTQDPATIICPVCASPLCGPVDVCTTCRTPHHQDCARFIGQCAVFGCGAYEFVTLDAQATAVMVDVAKIDEAAVVESAPAAPVAARPLGRGIFTRCRAGALLLWAHRSIAIPLLIFMVVGFSLPGGLFSAVASILGQATLVILFLARAKGKESGFREALSLANQRGGRIIGTGILSTLYTLPFTSGAAICLIHAFSSGSYAFIIPGLLLLIPGIRLSVSYALVPIVAAMGLEEEPKRALPRSRELVNVARRQATLGYIMFTGLAVAQIAVLAYWQSTLLEWLLVPLQTAVLLFATTYWFLFYLEARKSLQTSFLPYAPAGYLPERPAAGRAGGGATGAGTSEL